MSGCRLLVVWIALPLAYGNALCGRLENCSPRKVAVSVLTPDGDPLTDLSASDFSAEIGGKPVVIASAVYHTGPHRTVLVLDTSGSMTNAPTEWRSSVTAAKDFVAAVPSSMKLALLAFSDRIHAKLDFSSSTAMVQQKLVELENTQWGRLKGRRTTALYDALNTAVSLLQPANVGDSILLITDGEENESVQNPVRTQEALLDAGIRVFSLLIDARYFRKRLKEADTDWVRRLVALTGGDLITFFPNQRPADGLKHMVQMMSGFYVVDISPSTAIDRVRPWKLSVGADKIGRRKIKVSFAPRLAPCT